MNKDLTKTLPQSDSEKLSLILLTVQGLTVRVHNTEQTIQLLATNVVQLQEGQQLLVAEIGQQQEGQRRLEEGQASLLSELREMRREMKQNFLILSGKTLEDIRDLQRRVTRLEQKSPPNSQT